MSDPAEAEGQPSYAEEQSQGEANGEGDEAPSPSRLDNGLDAIDYDPGAQHNEEQGSNTGPSEQPDVISSYTIEGGVGVDQSEGQTQAQLDGVDAAAGEEEQPQEGSGEEGGEPDGYPPEDVGGNRAGDTLEQLDDQQQPQEGEEAAANEQGAFQQQDEAGAQEPDYAQAQDGQEAEGEGEGEGVAQDDGEDGPHDEEPQRPASASGEQPTASTSRPGSGAARPPSARPASGRPGSALPRRQSAGAGNSRPGSASTYNLTPEGVGMDDPASGAAGGIPAYYPAEGQQDGVGVGVGGSRPGTSQSGSRPGSRPGSQEARGPPGREAGLGGTVPETIPEDEPLAPAQIQRYIAAGLKAIDVEVETGPGLPRHLIRVLMDYTQEERKPYVGGYRNKRTGAVYHHAGTQTPRAPKYSEADRKLSRETQTVKQKQHSQQTVREQATQMPRPGVLVDTDYDREVVPGRYQTADEREAIVVRATRCIQRWVRGWLGRKRASYLRGKKAEREAFLREQEALAQKEAEEHRRREIQRRMHPRSAADFEVLYNELEAWRLQETRRIKEAGLPKDQEQQVLQQLLHKETKLLQTIDRLKINANQENKEARIQKTLNEMSKPKKFALRNGGKVDVHTPFTTRAKELQQLYNGLNLPLLTVDERLDVLLHVKWTVKEFDCDLTREVVDLIDREADLLNRGRNPKMLEGLRKRISSLFLNFIETPEFNPEATRFQIVPMDFETYLYEQVGRAVAKAGTTMGTRVLD